MKPVASSFRRRLKATQEALALLKTVKAVPISEAWLHENEQAIASVRQGLKESKEEKGVYRGSFAMHAKE